MLTALAQDTGSVPRIHIREPKTTCNSNSQEYNALWPLGTSTHVVYINSHRHTHTLS